MIRLLCVIVPKTNFLFMNSNRIARYQRLAFSSLFVFLICCASVNNAIANVLSKNDIADAITVQALNNRFPSSLKFSPDRAAPLVGQVNYTFDTDVHSDMAKVYLQYQPDYACFVAIDVDTGAILNLTSFIKEDEPLDNLVMRAEYPAASVFKLITAAAVLDIGKLSPQSIIPFNGKSTTLYKSQVLRHKQTKWTRTPSLKEAFAKSINPVFGRIGVFDLGANKVRGYAERFGFDSMLKTDFIVPQSRVAMPLTTQWELAEAASGYTRDITISPIHAAQLAAVVANGGKLVTPYMVESVSATNGELLYKAQPNAQPQVISTQSANSLRSLMRETVRIGSARKSFSTVNRYRVYTGMEIGGKTGSLTGFSPKGKHDWFVGYAIKDGKRIAYASLIINKEKWVVRSAYVARQFIYHYFTNKAARDKQSVAVVR